MSTLERALVIATEAHAGTVDRAGAPYILHPLRVMLQLQDEAGRIAALLHDVVEDSAWTLEALRAEGFSAEVLRAVDALTRREHEDYLEFCARAAGDPVARRVKLADLADNMDPARIRAPTERDLARLERYRQARALLLAAADDSADGQPRRTQPQPEEEPRWT